MTIQNNELRGFPNPGLVQQFIARLSKRGICPWLWVELDFGCNSGGGRKREERLGETCFRTSACLIFRTLAIFAVVGVAACSKHTASVDRSTARYLDRVSMTVADVSARAGISVDHSGTITAARSDGGTAVFAPSSADGGGFVGWLDLPKGHACAARLPAAYYVLDARVTATEAFLTLREVDGTARLEDLRFAVERIDSDAPMTAMAKIAHRPERFLLGRWFRCSDGIGHCAWALTLDAATSKCR